MNGFDIAVVDDQRNLVPTSSFSLARFSFEHFNPVQSRFVEFYDQPCNSLIAAATSCGKTAIAEIAIAHEVRKQGGKAIYLSPLRSLTQEKIDDWTDTKHHFSDLNLSICSGDYRLTADRKEELEGSDLILMTYEMFNSRLRNYGSENSEFLKNVKTIVIDEVHELGSEGRGHNLEGALMKFTSLNPQCRIVALSATMPNVEEVAQWISKLNSRKTYVIKSAYRPCPLVQHFITYEDKAWKYDQKELEKVLTALEIVEYYKEDKFLIFAHTKKTGDLMRKHLREVGIDSDFHNADVPKERRIKLERRFKEDPKFRVVIATSTLAAGVNLPARRVIVLGHHRGLKLVKSSQIAQQCGRSGRPLYDPRGDAYVLVPKSKEAESINYIKTIEPITSQMVDLENGDFKTLAFHLVSEIHQGTVVTTDDIFKWYERSLASLQLKDLDNRLVERMVNALRSRRILYLDEKGNFEVSSLGKLSSLFYYQPFDVADWQQNFSILFEEGKENDDYWIAVALSNVDSIRGNIVNSQEKEAMEDFYNKVLQPGLRKALGGKNGFSDGAVKLAFCYHSAMKGIISPALASATVAVRQDASRLVELLQALNGYTKWNKKEYIGDLGRRINQGVDWSLLDLCKIPGIGAVKAKKLWDASLNTVELVSQKPNLIRLALDCSIERADKIATEARKLLK